jgi:hypothetical protein
MISMRQFLVAVLLFSAAVFFANGQSDCPPNCNSCDKDKKCLNVGFQNFQIQISIIGGSSGVGI